MKTLIYTLIFFYYAPVLSSQVVLDSINGSSKNKFVSELQIGRIYTEDNHDFNINLGWKHKHKNKFSISSIVAINGKFVGFRLRESFQINKGMEATFGMGPIIYSFDEKRPLFPGVNVEFNLSFGSLGIYSRLDYIRFEEEKENISFSAGIQFEGKAARQIVVAGIAIGVPIAIFLAVQIGKSR